MLLAIDLEQYIEKALTDGSDLFQGVCWAAAQCWEEVQQKKKKNEYLHLLIPIFYLAITDKRIRTAERWKRRNLKNTLSK